MFPIFWYLRQLFHKNNFITFCRPFLAHASYLWYNSSIIIIVKFFIFVFRRSSVPAQVKIAPEPINPAGNKMVSFSFFPKNYYKPWLTQNLKPDFFHSDVYHMLTRILLSKGSQRDVVYLDWPIALSYLSPNAGGGEGFQFLSQWVQLYTWSTNKL